MDTSVHVTIGESFFPGDKSKKICLKFNESKLRKKDIGTAYGANPANRCFLFKEREPTLAEFVEDSTHCYSKRQIAVTKTINSLDKKVFSTIWSLSRFEKERIWGTKKKLLYHPTQKTREVPLIETGQLNDQKRESSPYREKSDADDYIRYAEAFKKNILQLQNLSLTFIFENKRFSFS